jgi:exopolysaccharide biosynthesis polyprenyl glycosylphosphotransferase
MRKNTLFITKLALLTADVVAILGALALAYFWRTRISSTPYSFESSGWLILSQAAVLTPIWLVYLYFSGLYRKATFSYRSREYPRIFLAGIVAMMLFISTEFFTGEVIFPAHSIAVAFVPIIFALDIFCRGAVKMVYRSLLSVGVGVQRVVFVGDNSITDGLEKYFRDNRQYGAIAVGKTDGKVEELEMLLKARRPDLVIQTNNKNKEQVFNLALNYHVGYYFTPNDETLLSGIANIEILDAQPVIEIGMTKLSGIWRFAKRFLDIVLGSLFLLLASPACLLIILAIKLTDSKGSVFFRQTRLTRFNQEFQIYKFRSHRSEYSGLSPEQAFAKMGRPELAKKYRKGGDQLERDPRLSKIGKFLRATSLDELPQLLNVVKGDLSLIGPRALVPEELKRHKKSQTILAVRSGLTGLAQVSGRRDISFDERRKLDVYYVQNWSLLLDLQILLKTFAHVLFGRGAK